MESLKILEELNTSHIVFGPLADAKKKSNLDIYSLLRHYKFRKAKITSNWGRMEYRDGWQLN